MATELERIEQELIEKRQEVLDRLVANQQAFTEQLLHLAEAMTTQAKTQMAMQEQINELSKLVIELGKRASEED